MLVTWVWVGGGDGESSPFGAIGACGGGLWIRFRKHNRCVQLITKKHVRWRRIWCDGPIRKNGFVESDVARNDDLICGKVEASVPSMVRWIANEYA